MITDQQRRKIFALFNQITKYSSRSQDYLHGWASGRFRVGSLNDLTNDQVDELIELLEARIFEYQEKITQGDPFNKVSESSNQKGGE